MKELVLRDGTELKVGAEVISNRGETLVYLGHKSFLYYMKEFENFQLFHLEQQIMTINGSEYVVFEPTGKVLDIEPIISTLVDKKKG